MSKSQVLVAVVSAGGCHGGDQYRGSEMEGSAWFRLEVSDTEDILAPAPSQVHGPLNTVYGPPSLVEDAWEEITLH